MNLVACTMGAGTLTIPYIVSLNGLILGPMIIIFGALLSFYSGHLLVKCEEQTGKYQYESLARLAFGKRAKPIISIFMIISMLGFAVSYIALVS